ncbi:MAG: thioesterase family protein [Treponema sp.]|nr:thioesterase family protein [Treponema sp.]
MYVTIGMQGECSETVNEQNIARRYGSGGLEVYATPAMIALMEGAAVAAVESQLPEGFSTVGTVVNIKHIAPTSTGATVHAHATLTAIDGRRLIFHVDASDNNGIIGEGTHERFIVDNVKFVEKARNRSKAI